jgi:hypothetical protein
MGLLRFRPRLRPGLSRRGAVGLVRDIGRVLATMRARSPCGSPGVRAAASRAPARPGVRGCGVRGAGKVRDEGHAACLGRPRYAADRQGGGPRLSSRWHPKGSLARARPGVRNGGAERRCEMRNARQVRGPGAGASTRRREGSPWAWGAPHAPPATGEAGRAALRGREVRDAWERAPSAPRLTLPLQRIPAAFSRHQRHGPAAIGAAPSGMENCSSTGGSRGACFASRALTRSSAAPAVPAPALSASILRSRARRFSLVRRVQEPGRGGDGGRWQQGGC